MNKEQVMNELAKMMKSYIDECYRIKDIRDNDRWEFLDTAVDSWERTGDQLNGALSLAVNCNFINYNEFADFQDRIDKIRHWGFVE